MLVVKLKGIRSYNKSMEQVHQKIRKQVRLNELQKSIITVSLELQELCSDH
jgi:hypothetical protein